MLCTVTRLPTAKDVFVADEAWLHRLIANGQVATQYVDDKGNVTKTEIAARAPAVTLESGKEYIIVNSYSGKSLDSGDSPAGGKQRSYILLFTGI